MIPKHKWRTIDIGGDSMMSYWILQKYVQVFMVVLWSLEKCSNKTALIFLGYWLLQCSLMKFSNVSDNYENCVVILSWKASIQFKYGLQVGMLREGVCTFASSTTHSWTPIMCLIVMTIDGRQTVRLKGSMQSCNARDRLGKKCKNWSGLLLPFVLHVTAIFFP